MLLGPESEERKYSELFWRFVRCGPKARPKKNFYILNFSIALSRWRKWFYYRWSGCQFGLSPPNDLLLVARFFFASSINFANIFASQHSCLLKLFAMRSRRSLDSERRQPQKILRWELFAMILFIFRGQRGALSLSSSRVFDVKPLLYILSIVECFFKSLSHSATCQFIVHVNSHCSRWEIFNIFYLCGF